MLCPVIQGTVSLMQACFSMKIESHLVKQAMGGEFMQISDL